MKDGECIVYYPVGRLMIVNNYEHGLLSGLQIFYRENGQKIEELHMSNDERHGSFRMFDSCGRVYVVGEFQHGRLWNITEMRDMSGNQHNFGNFKNGEGEISWIGSNGYLSKRGRYVDGRRDGTWTEFDSTGNSIRTFEYKDGWELYNGEPLTFSNY